MEDIEKIHTLARKYCMVKSTYWGRKYSKLIEEGTYRLDSGGYTLEAKRLFPRYIVLDAILPEIERFVPNDFSSKDEVKNSLLYTIQNAQNELTKVNNDDTTCQETMDEERQAFYDFIEKKYMEIPQSVRPISYRRTLSSQESKMLWIELKKKWSIDINDYWYPLISHKPNDTEAFMDDYFYAEVGIDHLIKILKKRNVQRVFELREGSMSPEYEIDLENFNPAYNINGEGFWFSSDLDWVIYASHENSTTIAGAWLLAEIKKVWSNWEERTWLDWKERLERGL